jgi:hypothetical protein
MMSQGTTICNGLAAPPSCRAWRAGAVNVSRLIHLLVQDGRYMHAGLVAALERG